MGHKVVTEKRTIEKHIHNFYCDKCGKHLGHTTEFEDGYYTEIGDLSLMFYTPRGWRYFKKYACPDCREAYLSEVDDALSRLGFQDSDYFEEDEE